MKRHLLTMTVLAVASVAGGQEPEEGDDLRGTAAFGGALAERLIACVEAEGSAVGSADREVLHEVSRAMGPGLARSLCGEDCADDGRTRAECAAQIRGLGCDALAARMRPAAPEGRSPTWAMGLARALVGRIGACAAEERDGGSLAESERALLTDFERELAGALGSLGASGTCAANENALPACAVSVGAVSCEGLGARLSEDPSALARTITPACAAMIRCGAALLDDGGAEASDASEALPPEAL